MQATEVINSESPQVRSASGFKGIIRSNPRGTREKWEAFIMIQHKKQVKKIYIGVYDSIEEAVREREEFIRSLF